MRMHHFQTQNESFAPNEIFFNQTIKIVFMYLLAHFIAQNFKKNSSSGSNIMRTCQFLAHLPQMKFFSEKSLI